MARSTVIKRPLGSAFLFYLFCYFFALHSIRWNALTEISSVMFINEMGFDMTLSQGKIPRLPFFIQTISQSKHTTTKKLTAPNLENESSPIFYFYRLGFSSKKILSRNKSTFEQVVPAIYFVQAKNKTDNWFKWQVKLCLETSSFVDDTNIETTWLMFDQFVRKKNNKFCTQKKSSQLKKFIHQFQCTLYIILLNFKHLMFLERKAINLQTFVHICFAQLILYI